MDSDGHCAGSLPAIHVKVSVPGALPVCGTERRSELRFQIHLPLIVRWTSGSTVDEAITESRDVSSRAIYFMLPKDIKNGSAVEIEMTLPHEITLAGPIKMRFFGRVRRTVSQPDRRVGVVAKIERYEFLCGDERALKSSLPTRLRLQRI